MTYSLEIGYAEGQLLTLTLPDVAGVVAFTNTLMIDRQTAIINLPDSTLFVLPEHVRYLRVNPALL